MGGGGEVQKNIHPRKLNEKNLCTPIKPKKYSCHGLKKIHTRNLITTKNSCGSKTPHPPHPPPHNFSNGPSLYDYKDMVSLNLIPGAMKDFVKLSTSTIQSTPDNSNLQGKCKKVRVIGSSSYRG